MGWQTHLDQLLYEGERVIETASGHSVGLVVTSHRLLVFTPELEGKNFQVLQRPNVTGINSEERGPAKWLSASMKWAIGGVAMAIGGLVLDLEGVMGSTSTAGADAVGVGWIGGVFSLFQTAFSLLDDVLLFAGLLGIGLSLALFGWYWANRAETMTVEVAGREDLELPAAGLTTGAIRGLGDAIDPPVAGDSNPSNR